MGEPELLNQRIIDGLFVSRGRLQPDAAAEPDPQPYSFLRPSRLGRRSQLRFEAVHGTFAQGLRKAFSLQLRAQADVTVTGVETVFYSEFAHSLGEPAAAFPFPVGRPGGPLGLLNWDNDLALGLVDRLLGGVGDPGPSDRPLTAIERGILRHITLSAMNALREAWDSLLFVGTEVKEFESSPASLEIARAEDRFLVGILRLRIENLEGVLTVGIPFAEAPSFADDVPAAKTDGTPMSQEAGERALDATTLRHTRLTVSARLPELTLSMKALAGLRVGQVLDSGHALDTPVQIYTNGRLLFTGAVGEVRGQVGVQVIGRATLPAAERPATVKQGRVLS